MHLHTNNSPFFCGILLFPYIYFHTGWEWRSLHEFKIVIYSNEMKQRKWSQWPLLEKCQWENVSNMVFVQMKKITDCRFKCNQVHNPLTAGLSTVAIFSWSLFQGVFRLLFIKLNVWSVGFIRNQESQSKTLHVFPSIMNALVFYGVFGVLVLLQDEALTNQVGRIYLCIARLNMAVHFWIYPTAAIVYYTINQEKWACSRYQSHNVASSIFNRCSAMFWIIMGSPFLHTFHCFIKCLFWYP